MTDGLPPFPRNDAIPKRDAWLVAGKGEALFLPLKRRGWVPFGGGMWGSSRYGRVRTVYDDRIHESAVEGQAVLFTEAGTTREGVDSLVDDAKRRGLKCLKLRRDQ